MLSSLKRVAGNIDLRNINPRKLVDDVRNNLPPQGPPMQVLSQMAEPVPNQIMGGIQQLGGLLDRADRSFASTLGRSGYFDNGRGRAAVASPISDLINMEVGNGITKMDKYGLLASNIGARVGVPLMAAGLTSNVIGNAYDALKDVPVFGKPEEDESLMIRYS